MWWTLRANFSRGRMLVSRLRRDYRDAKQQRANFYRDMWQDAAADCGGDFRVLDGDLIEISRGDAVARFIRNITPLDDPATLRFVGNKALVHECLREAGLPTPDFRAFGTKQLQASHDFHRNHSTCVIKPAFGTGSGHGVTTGIETASQLRKAALTAAAFCPELIIEEQIPGENYRLLFLDGELLDAIRRRPPAVTGDGRRTIRELVEASNKARLAAGYQVAQVVLAFDPDMRRTLRQAGLSLSTVPAEGVVVVLKTAINDNQADENESVTDVLAQSIIAAARRAAVVTGVRLAGVDIITTAPDRSLEDSGGVILEVNTTPGLHFHYHKRGDAVRVAVPIVTASLLAAERKRDFNEAAQHVD